MSVQNRGSRVERSDRCAWRRRDLAPSDCGSSLAPPPPDHLTPITHALVGTSLRQLQNERSIRVHRLIVNDQNCYSSARRSTEAGDIR